MFSEAAVAAFIGFAVAAAIGVGFYWLLNWLIARGLH